MNAHATYRLQLHAGFTFDDAAQQIDYFRQLGITDLYASPILSARAGSMHGYDVVDPTTVNPALGGEDGLRRLVRRLRDAGMGLIVDIVPNHMAVGAENAYWMDLLEKGLRSPYAAFFDINWAPPDLSLTGKVLLPILGEPYRDILQAGQFDLARDADRIMLTYGDHRLPLRTEDSARLLRESDAGLAKLAGDHDALDDLLTRQHYRLAWSRTAGDRINWRRFFDINELIAVQVERPEVFEFAHGTILRLYGEGLIDGLRIDHIDGLTDPAGYCCTLRERLSALEARRPTDAPTSSALLVVEKILAAGERLPAAWQTDGATGYEAMNEIAALLHDPAGETPLTGLWQELSGRPGDFESEEHIARREVLVQSFAGQHDFVTRAFHLAAQIERPALEISEMSCRRALTALLEVFPVYRTYATLAGAGPDDASVIAAARAQAAPNLAAIDGPALDFICATLLSPTYDNRAQADASIAFQKLSAPLTAKAVEDTGFYRYGRLLSRNDVGSDIRRFAGTPDEFHRFCVARAAETPRALTAIATHDHKRGEDVRARLAVLSELPDEWAAAVHQWRQITAAERPPGLAPDDEYQLYQTIVGAWPLDLALDDRAGLGDFAQRLKRWQEKALREAKLRSSWAAPHQVYEAAAAGFIDRLLDPRSGAAFLNSAHDFIESIAVPAALNGLTQAFLRCVMPGSPDLYQGCEFWDFSLVDPDNRREVDYRKRAASLSTQSPAMHLKNWRDGRVKQAIIARALAIRHAMAGLFCEGGYEPLAVTGEQAGSIIAFARRHCDSAIIAVAARHGAPLLIGKSQPLPNSDDWGDTAITLPAYAANSIALSAFEGNYLKLADQLPMGVALATMPIALLILSPKK